VEDPFTLKSSDNGFLLLKALSGWAPSLGLITVQLNLVQPSQWLFYEKSLTIFSGLT